MDRSQRIGSLFSLLAIIIVCMILVSLISAGFWKICGLDFNEVLEGQTLNSQERLLLRLGLMINHAGTFLIPAILYCFIFLRGRVKVFLRLDSFPQFSNVFLWGLTILFSYPCIAQLTEWNMSIPLPEWMSTSQSQALALLEQTLKMESPIELGLSVLLVGVLAALGEELIFRGIVQEQLHRIFANPHKAIIISSLIFGSFHLQFERLLPLSLLGLILGYSYYYSKSLMVPIILHFLNNSFQIFGIYIVSNSGEMPAIDEVPDLPWSIVVVSAILTSFTAFKAVKNARLNNE